MIAPTVAEMRAWPPTVPLWPHAAGAVGLGRSAIYDLARRKALPFPVLHLGRLLKVPTAELLAVLGIAYDPTHDEGPSAATASGPYVAQLPHSRHKENNRVNPS